MWLLAKSILAGIGALALVGCAFWLWLQYEIKSLGGGYVEFTPNKPRLTAIMLLIFATAFFWQYRSSRKG